MQDSPPAAGREATNSGPLQCDPREALFCFIGMRRISIKQKRGQRVKTHSVLSELLLNMEQFFCSADLLVGRHTHAL